jgi:hypothetical protein
MTQLISVKEMKQLISNIKTLCFVEFTWHQHFKGHMATFQLYKGRKTSDVPPYIISGMIWHLSRTIGILLTS